MVKVVKGCEQGLGMVPLILAGRNGDIRIPIKVC